jgi:hypothetical protein
MSQKHVHAWTYGTGKALATRTKLPVMMQTQRQARFTEKGADEFDLAQFLPV